jgi:pimeloyl-ACP methyl ester carboxylesterase
VADKLGDVPMPALLVSADEDYTPVVMKERAVAQMPRAELAVVEDSRHATPVEHPERFNAIVRDFMARVEAGGPIGREAEEEAGKQEAG